MKGVGGRSRDATADAFRQEPRRENVPNSLGMGPAAGESRELGFVLVQPRFQSVRHGLRVLPRQVD